MWDTSDLVLTQQKDGDLSRGGESRICCFCEPPAPALRPWWQIRANSSLNSCPWRPLPPHLTHAAMSLCSQGWGPLGRAPVGWHLLAGPQPPGSLADSSALPGSPRPGGHPWTQPELLKPEGRFCSLHYGVLPRGSAETSRKLERQCPYGQLLNIHPTNTSCRHQGVASCVEYCGREKFRKKLTLVYSHGGI